ncbi:MAG: hypothetical protein EBR88_04440, partial [Betaproteobacteria bacterium]|nr:hypothetical protein [Betaproteobacteria bacterium]
GPTITKFLTLPARTLRFGATGGPWFALPNWFRDQFNAATNSQTGFVPFLDGVKGIYHAWAQTPEYERWREAGGRFSGLTTSTQAFTQMVEDVLPKDPSARRVAKALVSPTHVARALSYAGTLLEEATRVQEFRRALAQGKTDLEAANLSKLVTLNFARAGQYGRTVNMLSAFFNAKVQDLDLVIQNHRTRPGEVAMKGLMYITVPSVLCWALGKDDEKIQNLPEWRKNLFWNVNLDPIARALGRKTGFILSVPKPFIMGALYGTSVERALDYATGRDPNGARKAVMNLLGSPFEIAETPLNIAGIKPLIELTANYDYYKGAPVVPERLRNLPAVQQYDLNTSETAKMLGYATGTSPMKIDHLLRGYFATAARFGTDAIDYGMSKLGMAEIPPAPRKDVFELPILNRFAGSPYQANAFVERFYNAASDMEGKLQVHSKQADEMTDASLQRWWKANGAELQHYQHTMSTGRAVATEVRRTQRTLAEINKAMKEVQADQKMLPDLKRSKLMDLANQRNATAEQGFKTLFPESVRKRHY